MVKSGKGLAMAAAAASLAMVAACGGESGPKAGAPAGTTPPTGTATHPPATTPSPSSSPISFGTGQCLDDQPAWKQVPCDGPHFYEVAAVVKDAKYAGNPVERTAYRNSVCDRKSAAYLRGPAYGSLLLGAPIPVAADPDNARQIVCVISQQKPDGTGIVARTSSVKGALAGGGFNRYKMCLQGKASAAEVTLAPCSGPHVSESTFGFIMGRFGQRYPGASTIKKASLAKCLPKDKAYIGGVTRSDIGFAQNGPGKGTWDRGHRLAICFVQVGSGKITGTLKGIGTRPLSTVRR